MIPSETMRTFVRNYYPFLILGIAGLALMLWGVNLPYVGIYNANNNYLALASKNFLRFGFINLGFLPTYFAGGVLPPQPPFYLHHPVLFFIIAAVPFALFGSADWVVHAATFLFTVSSVVALYFLVREVWDERAAVVAAAVSSVFPMTTFFWKYEFFEQITLFLNLIVLIAYVKYLKTGKRSFLKVIFFVSFAAVLSDWYGLYLLFPFAYMLFTKYRKRTKDALVWYIAAAIFGISVFLTAVYSAYGSFDELIIAIRARSFAAELYSLPYWPLRLMLISVVRSVLFFTPIPFLGAIQAFRKRNTQTGLKRHILVMLFVLGILNLVFLPTATWGHSYFLYYLIPFFAVCSALVLVRLRHTGWILPVILFVAVWSTGVNFLKLQQITKQVWKYEFGKTVSQLADRHEKIGVVNYPGDVLQNYWFIQAEPMDMNGLERWFRDSVPDYRMVVFTCSGECTEEEKLRAAEARNFMRMDTYQYGANYAWVFRKHVRPGDQSGVAQGETYLYPDPWTGQPGIIMSAYRFIRDRIGGMQI